MCLYPSVAIWPIDQHICVTASHFLAYPMSDSVHIQIGLSQFGPLGQCLKVYILFFWCWKQSIWSWISYSS